MDVTFEKVFESINEKLENDEITFEYAEALTEAAYERYCVEKFEDKSGNAKIKEEMKKLSKEYKELVKDIKSEIKTGKYTLAENNIKKAKSLINKAESTVDKIETDKLDDLASDLMIFLKNFAVEEIIGTINATLTNKAKVAFINSASKGLGEEGPELKASTIMLPKQSNVVSSALFWTLLQSGYRRLVKKEPNQFRAKINTYFSKCKKDLDKMSEQLNKLK